MSKVTCTWRNLITAYKCWHHWPGTLHWDESIRNLKKGANATIPKAGCIITLSSVGFQSVGFYYAIGKQSQSCQSTLWHKNSEIVKAMEVEGYQSSCSRLTVKQKSFCTHSQGEQQNPLSLLRTKSGHRCLAREQEVLMLAKVLFLWQNTLI